MLSLGAIRWTLHTESVFALSESENVAVFKRIKDNEQHSFLFRLCGKGFVCPAIPHIYSSVGYCIVYLIRVSHNLQIDRRNNLTLSFCTNPSFEVGGTTINNQLNTKYHEKDFIYAAFIGGSPCIM